MFSDKSESLYLKKRERNLAHAVEKMPIALKRYHIWKFDCCSVTRSTFSISKRTRKSLSFCLIPLATVNRGSNMRRGLNLCSFTDFLHGNLLRGFAEKHEGSKSPGISVCLIIQTFFKISKCSVPQRVYLSATIFQKLCIVHTLSNSGG